MTAAVPLVERLAEALGRERDPGEHSPLCSDAEPCRYCMKLARALLPVVEQAVAEARGAERAQWETAIRYIVNTVDPTWDGPEVKVRALTILRSARADAIATTEGPQ